jgi:hypothetical protein
MRIPAGYAQVNVMFSGSGVPTGAQTTIGLTSFGVIDNPVDMGNAFLDALGSSGVMQNFSGSIQVDGCLVKFGPNNDGPSALVIGPLAGGAANTAVAPNTALLVNKTTLLGGRRNRGRWYWPGLPEGDVDQGGNVAGGFLNAVQIDFDSFYTKLGLEDLYPSLLHSEDIGLILPALITSFVVQPKVATQRRRLRR